MKDLFGRKIKIPHAKKKIWKILVEYEEKYDGETKNLVLFLLDGTPYEEVRRYLPGAMPLESTNITSTVPAVTSLVLQKEPSEHGLLSWSFYFEELKGIYEPATAVLYPGVEVPVGEEKLSPAPPHLPQSFEDLFFILPKKYETSPWSKFLTRGYQKLPYTNFIHLREVLGKLFRRRRNFFAIVYIYEPDATLHAEGNYGFVKEVLSYLHWLLYPLRRRKNFEKTEFVLLSDHGHTQIEEYAVFPEEANEFLNYPLAGENRDVFLYTGGDISEKLLEVLEELSDRFFVIGGEDALYSGFFGEEVTEVAEKRVPDILLSAKGNTSLLVSGEIFVSSHGGLTEREKFGFIYSAPGKDLLSTLKRALSRGL